MSSKNIYRIDNYFITMGYVFFIVGALSVAFDPGNWNDLVIKEKLETTTQISWDNKNGRTLEQVRQEKGERFVVEEVSRGFPLIRVIIIANGLALLMIGYVYRSREKKIISIWNALEHTGEAQVDGLCVSLGLSREFILKHLKDINAQRQSAYTYDSRSDKIIHNKLSSEFLVFVDCTNCGHQINEKVSLDLSNPPRCRYCGTGVSAEHLNTLKQDVLKQGLASPAPPGSLAPAGGEINIGILIVLMLLFWPAAVFYVIKKKAMA